MKKALFGALGGVLGLVAITAVLFVLVVILAFADLNAMYSFRDFINNTTIGIILSYVIEIGAIVSGALFLASRAR